MSFSRERIFISSSPILAFRIPVKDSDQPEAVFKYLDIVTHFLTFLCHLKNLPDKTHLKISTLR